MCPATGPRPQHAGTHQAAITPAPLSPGNCPATAQILRVAWGLHPGLPLHLPTDVVSTDVATQEHDEAGHSSVHRKRFWALAPGPLPASPPSSPWAGTGRSSAWERSWKAPSVTLRGLEGTSPAHNFPAVGTDMSYPSSGPLSLRVEGRGSWSLREKEYSDAVKYREGRNPAALIRLPHRYWASCLTPQMSGAAAPGMGVSLGCKAGAPRETSDLYPGFWKVVRAHASGLGSLFWLLAPDAPRFLGPEAAFTGRSVGPSQPRGSQHLGPKL